ncbi:hypothetical protein EUX98_g6655 [Antrodiella citrinella]|uniref:DUF6533 domain-containing protein n=1 Tax=Antrodiella citrinella TaxID=2447956 RepID=A0A4S4MQZ4_9APHY|nr:hypothetical protein EUX98_g6655 [Antrodiella citrinella]
MSSSAEWLELRQVRILPMQYDLALIQYSSFISYICKLIPATIVVYDTILTSNREINCIWRRKHGLVTILFISQRYVMMLLTLLRLFSLMDLMVLFSTIRTWAVCGRFNAAVFLVFLCGMFEPAANIYNYSRYRGFSVDEFGCNGATVVVSPADQFPYSMPIITRCIAIATDLLVLVITWTKTTDVWRASREMKQFRPKLYMLLLRDGTMYFSSIFILNLISLILYALFTQSGLQGVTWFVGIAEAISPLLISRFILDLRTVDDPNRDLSGIPDLPTIRFASSGVVADLAAPFRADSDWCIGPSMDEHNDADEQKDRCSLCPDSVQVSDCERQLENWRYVTNFYVLYGKYGPMLTIS